MKDAITIVFNRECFNRKRVLSIDKNLIQVDTFDSFREKFRKLLADLFHVDYYDITLYDSDDNNEYMGRIEKDYFEDIYFDYYYGLYHE
jgi:hypothetical protein